MTYNQTGSIEKEVTRPTPRGPERRSSERRDVPPPRDIEMDALTEMLKIARKRGQHDAHASNLIHLVITAAAAALMTYLTFGTF